MLVVVPYIRKNVNQNEDIEVGEPVENIDPKFVTSDPPETTKIFSYLQIMTAVFGSFAHGGNDVSNAIGPLIGMWLIFQEGIIASNSEPPFWIMIYGGYN